VQTISRRIERLENHFRVRRLEDVRDVRELSSVELAWHVLDGLPSSYAALREAPEWAFLLEHLDKGSCEHSGLDDPLEAYAASLLSTIIHGHRGVWTDAPHPTADPLLAERFRGRFPIRVFDAAERGRS
jgi:hypothetical protein